MATYSSCCCGWSWASAVGTCVVTHRGTLSAASALELRAETLGVHAARPGPCTPRVCACGEHACELQLVPRRVTSRSVEYVTRVCE